MSRDVMEGSATAARLLMLGWAMVLLAGCGGPAAGRQEERLTGLDTLLREGDLLFRRGAGLTSRAVLAADAHGSFSHIGIVVADSAGWQVVHAVPGEPDYRGDPDRVKMEPPATFFRPDRALRGAVMRLDDPMAARAAAAEAMRIAAAGVLFDHDYDLDDSSRMYCTELIHRVFAQQGIDISDGRRTPIDLPGFGGLYILPSDLQQSTRLIMIHQF